MSFGSARRVELAKQLILRRGEAGDGFGVLADDAHQLIDLHAVRNDSRVGLVDLLFALLTGAPLPQPHRAHQPGDAEIGEIVQGVRDIGEELERHKAPSPRPSPGVPGEGAKSHALQLKNIQRPRDLRDAIAIKIELDTRAA